MNEELTGFDPNLQSEHFKKDFKIGAIRDIFKYKPKHTVYEVETRGVKNQVGQRDCVLESLAGQKEVDENCDLSPQSITAYLKSVGLITARGTSLSASQDGLRNWGIAEWNLTPNKYNVSFEEFAHAKHMTKEVVENALTHKSKSSYSTSNVYKVIEKLDKDQVGQTASEWWSNHYNIRKPFLFDIKGTGNLDYHAWLIVGYDMDKKQFKCKNSFGEDWGEKGYFYLRFEDFDEVCQWGVYFNSDMPKDLVGWLSIHAGQAVKEKGGSKIYLIQADRKCHIPDMPMLHMLDKLTSFMEDKEGMLSYVKDGDPVDIDDIPPSKVEEVREQIRLLRDANFADTAYGKYFPEYFKS